MDGGTFRRFLDVIPHLMEAAEEGHVGTIYFADFVIHIKRDPTVSIVISKTMNAQIHLGWESLKNLERFQEVILNKLAELREDMLQGKLATFHIHVADIMNK